MKLNFTMIIKTLGKALLNIIMTLLKLTIPIIFLIVLFILIVLCFYIYYRYVKKIKPIKSDNSIIKKDGFFKKIFWLLPQRLVLDYLYQDPTDFAEFGIHLICGPQGSGKTMTMVYLLKEWQRKYPLLKVYSNFSYSEENGELKHWRDLIIKENGKKGVANAIDEIQTWFSSGDSKDIDPAFLAEISQQRKQKKATLGTAQVFSRCAKPLREQAHFVYLPYTFMNNLVVVFKTKTDYWNNEKQKFTKYVGFFFFVQTEKLRESYDTFKKIERWKEEDYISNANFVVGDSE